jgi:hypothetical protein
MLIFHGYVSLPEGMTYSHEPIQPIHFSTRQAAKQGVPSMTSKPESTTRPSEAWRMAHGSSVAMGKWWISHGKWPIYRWFTY